MARTAQGRARLSALCRRALASVAVPSVVILATAQANAQTSSAGSAPQQDPPCRVFTVDGPDDSSRGLFAGCGGHGLMLGRTTGYEVIGNGTLKATLIDTRTGGERRVLLITIQDDGSPLVEDLGVDLAVAAGRGAMTGLEGLELDFSSFADDGTIRLRPATGAAGKDSSGEIHIGQQIAAERVRRRTAK